MAYFPILINLEDKECLVVGAGEVGFRKVKLLTKFKPKKITVVDPQIKPSIRKELKRISNVELLERVFSERDLEGKDLVIASTNDSEVNHKISELCKKKKILCNVIDTPKFSSFIVPAILNMEDLIVAVSTSGGSPALAKKIKEEIKNFFGEEYKVWIKILKRLRPHILNLKLEKEKNREIFNLLSQKDILILIQKKDKKELKSKILSITSPKLKSIIDEIIDECIN